MQASDANITKEKNKAQKVQVTHSSTVAMLGIVGLLPPTEGCFHF